ncbi:MAG: hypothetical protein HY815_06015 [Candidatus Riflebacteria bacterium]|nr:hypothetical protein [Candidatus Riflebacteria bacterium]
MTPADDRPSCARVQGWLVDTAYEERSDESATRVEEHLRSCPGCSAVAASISRVARVDAAPLDLCLDEMVPAPVRQRARDVIVEACVRRLASALTPWILALPLAVLSTWIVFSRPALAGVSFVVELLQLLAWTALYATLVRWLGPGSGSAGGGAGSWIRGRAVVYGVLGAVVLSVAVLGLYVAYDHTLHMTFTRMVAGGLRDLVALLVSGALLLTGLGMGFLLGRESVPNMILVLLVYTAIMFPALGRGCAPLIRAEDFLFALVFVSLWGLSGAHVGTLLGSHPSDGATA